MALQGWLAEQAGVQQQKPFSMSLLNVTL